mgnify:CR=1 FL=1
MKDLGGGVDGRPLDAYRESMEQSLSGGDPVPQWYLAVEDGAILGGLGVIDNDFHNRKDLAPNVCSRNSPSPHGSNPNR